MAAVRAPTAFQSYWYDAEGRTAFETHWVFDGVSWPTQEEHYYDGAGRLVLIERHSGLGADSIGHVEDNDLHMLTEWYRYDALGRRVLVFTNHNVQAFCDIEGCESTLSRYVWAGDQLLYETRAPAADSLTSSTIETDTPSGDGEYGLPKAYGTVGYTHAGGIDRPLGVLRIDNGSLTTAFYPHLNWRGLYETATTDTGTEFHSRDFIKWPGAVASAYLGANTKPDSAFWWYGSQITESADASGLMYRRNRYYDPASGRFTQPDPAGVGGGLNSYGFASGDPVNRSDPFGLSDCDWDHPQECKVASATASAESAGEHVKAQVGPLKGQAGVKVGPTAELSLHADGSVEHEEGASLSAGAELKWGDERVAGSNYTVSCSAGEGKCRGGANAEAGKEGGATVTASNWALGGEVTVGNITVGLEVDAKGSVIMLGHLLVDGASATWNAFMGGTPTHPQPGSVPSMTLSTPP